jgi:hypothetical protein
VSPTRLGQAPSNNNNNDNQKIDQLRKIPDPDRRLAGKGDFELERN